MGQTYSITNDFGGVIPNKSQLQTEIDNSSIAKTCVYIRQDEDVILIQFDQALDSGEETTLDGLVAAHVPLPYIDIHYIEENEILTTTSSTFQQALRLSMPNVPAGDYLISWSSALGNTNNLEAEMQVELDDTTLLYTAAADIADNSTAPRRAASGSKKVTLTKGTHNIDIDYRAPDGGSACIEHLTITAQLVQIS